MKVMGMTIPLFTVEFEAMIERYEKIIGEKTQLKFNLPSKDISVAKIGNILVIGGSEENIAPLRSIKATLVVDSIEEYFKYFKRENAIIIQPPTPTPTGKNMIVRGIDGITFEYVELIKKS